MKHSNKKLPVNIKNNKPPYQVGYKKPPKHTRFTKGQSGNNNGRPKGALNKPKDLPTNLLNKLIIKECSREITIQEGNKRKKVTMIEATLKSVAMKSVKGDHKSHKLLLDLYGFAEKCESELQQEFFETVYCYKTGALKELEEAKEQGLPIPDIIPHPHHMKINTHAGTAEINGPLCEDDKLFWDRWLARKLGWLKEIEEIDQILESGIEPFDGSKLCKIGRKGYEDDREYLVRLVNIVRKLIPDDYYIPPSSMEYINSKPDIWDFSEEERGLV